MSLPKLPSVLTGANPTDTISGGGSCKVPTELLESLSSIHASAQTRAGRLSQILADDDEDEDISDVKGSRRVRPAYNL